MENQTTEWKQMWHDEDLKCVCAFANTHGGILTIGKNDKGEIVGVANAQKLLEDIPNKIRSALGIVADVSLLSENGAGIIRIVVDANTYPISCNGKYYIRSGSTTQELSGRDLDTFILRKQGRTWDGVPVPNVTADDFERDAFKLFRRKAIAAVRMSEEDLRISDALLLENLRLTDGGYLKRAALLLFHQEPERWFTGAYVKIGMFRNAADLESQDEIHGPLIAMPDKVVELVYLKYFRGKISYSGIQRIETYPIPRSAFREVVLNAIVHKDYSTGNPIHIHIYPDKVLVYNDGRLPEKWTAADLFAPHTSKPFNPDIANGFFRAGLIEAWGRGIEKIRISCQNAGLQPPTYHIKPTEVVVGFTADIGEPTTDATTDATTNATGDAISDRAEGAIGSCDEDAIGSHRSNGIGGCIGNAPEHATNDGVVKSNKTEGAIGSCTGNAIGGCASNGISDRAKDAIGNSIGDRISDRIGDSTGEPLSLNQAQTRIQILSLMRENPAISAKAISAAIHISARNVEAHIKHLKNARLLKRIGTTSTRKGRWIVK